MLLFYKKKAFLASLQPISVDSIMALGRCNVCHERLRFGSRICDKCGAKKSRVKLYFGVVIVAQIGVIGWYQYFHTKRPGIKFVVEDNAAHIAPIVATSSAGWVYYETRDDLVHDVTRHARVLSRGAANTGLSNDTSASGVLELRASSVYGSSAILSIKRQAFDLVEEACNVHAEFDAKDAMDVHAACSKDGEQATVMIEDATVLMQKMRGAHDMSLDVRLSPKVERTVLFEVAGLKI